MITTIQTLALLAPVTFVGGEDDSATWLELDREFAALTAVPTASHEGHVKASLDMITSYQSSDAAFYARAVGEELSGFVLRRARATFKALLAVTLVGASILMGKKMGAIFRV